MAIAIIVGLVAVVIVALVKRAQRTPEERFWDEQERLWRKRGKQRGPASQGPRHLHRRQASVSWFAKGPRLKREKSERIR
jgi:hypothetical protein